MSLNFAHVAPQCDEYRVLRKSVGWGETPADAAAVALGNSLFHVTARSENVLIGMGRVIGDGALFYYIQDLMVHPEFQHQGVGSRLMTEIEGFLSEHAGKGATIGLFAAKGKEAFYQQYGYSRRDGSALGHGMCKFC